MQVCIPVLLLCIITIKLLSVWQSLIFLDNNERVSNHNDDLVQPNGDNIANSLIIHAISETSRRDHVIDESSHNVHRVFRDIHNKFVHKVYPSKDNDFEDDTAQAKE